MQTFHCLLPPCLLCVIAPPPFICYYCSADCWHPAGHGGAVCLPARPQAALGGVPEQVLRRQWLQVQAFLL